MSIIEKANEIVGNVGDAAMMSLGDLIGSAFMGLVMFFVDLLLGM